VEKGVGNKDDSLDDEVVLDGSTEGGLVRGHSCDPPDDWEEVNDSSSVRPDIDHMIPDRSERRDHHGDTPEDDFDSTDDP
jgi:hypothetical protein